MRRSQRLSSQGWRQIIGGQRSSGLSVAAYCRERGISEASFYTWKRRLGSPAPAFVEVKHPHAPTAGALGAIGALGALEIMLPGERRLLVRRGFDPDLLTELIRALEDLPSREALA